MRWIYLHSLLLAFLTIFLAAVAVHATAGLGSYNSALAASHQRPVSILGYVANVSLG